MISTINPNQTVTNTARAAWTSLDGDLPLIERTGADGPGPDATVLNNYVSRGSVSFNAQNVAIAKAIVSTSETSTAANNLLTIGEIVRYQRHAYCSGGTDAEFADSRLPADRTDVFE